MDFDLTPRQTSWRDLGGSLGRTLTAAPAAAEVIAAAVRAGLLEPPFDLVAQAVAIEALASESAAAGMMLALHVTAMQSAPTVAVTLASGEAVGALSLSSEQIPTLDGEMVSGSATWIGPITPSGVALVGARAGDEVTARVVRLNAPGVALVPQTTSGLEGLAWAHATFSNVTSRAASPPADIVALARTLIAAVALGIGQRALRESLVVAERYKGAGGEQTVQGLLADTATELDAARLLTWKAAADGPSVAGASMAKLAAAVAALAAVVRATQIVGVDSFQRGHAIERLTQDVRAIELFAGRTEALRESVAAAELPRVS